MDILVQYSEALYLAHISINGKIEEIKDNVEVDVLKDGDIPGRVMFTFVYVDYLAA